MCEISVLMPVYNDELYLNQAINSVLKQTYKNFELIILLEYGSSAKCKEIVYSYKDSRIKVIENKSKLGLPNSLNVGIRCATGKYIARMDSDDICLPKRFEIEYNYLEKHQDVAMVGCECRVNGKIYSRLHMPRTYEQIIFATFFKNSLLHPTVMWRRELFIINNYYYKDLKESEDYELWTRVIQKLKVENISKVLLSYRVGLMNKSVLNRRTMLTNDYSIQNSYYKLFGFEYNLSGAFFESNLSIKQIENREALAYVICKYYKENLNFKEINCVFEDILITLYLVNNIFDCKRFWKKYKYLYDNNKFDMLRIGSHQLGRYIRKIIKMMLNKIRNANKLV
jgi:glycosyltransferase involved in cell wall biosynthesis